MFYLMHTFLLFVSSQKQYNEKMSGRYRVGSNTGSQWQQVLIVVVFLFVSGSLFYRLLIQHIWKFSLALSVISFLAMYHDKQQSQQRGYRVSESVLLMLSMLGGWPGSLLAMTVLRHKRRKTSYVIMFIASICVHLYFMNRIFHFIPWTV